MNDYHDRLETRGLLKAFIKARATQDGAMMRRILVAAEFSEMEIESIMWSKGINVEGPVVEADKWTRLREAIVGRLATAIVSGVILGGAFVWVSSGFSDAPKGQGMNRAMKDYRTPKEAYYRPFVWGFVIGVFGALATGTLVYNPTEKE